MQNGDVETKPLAVLNEYGAAGVIWADDNLCEQNIPRCQRDIWRDDNARMWTFLRI